MIQGSPKFLQFILYIQPVYEQNQRCREVGGWDGWQVYKAQDCHTTDMGLTSESPVWSRFRQDMTLFFKANKCAAPAVTVKFVSIKPDHNLSPILIKHCECLNITITNVNNVVYTQIGCCTDLRLI